MKKCLSLLLSLALLLSLCSVTAVAEVMGDGSEQNPYLVASEQDLKDAIQKCSGAKNNIKLMSDITLTNNVNIMRSLNIDLNQKTIFGGYALVGVSPFVFRVKNGYFKGSSRLWIDECRNFTVENVEFEGDSPWLLDITNSSGKIHNCFIKTTGAGAMGFLAVGSSPASYTIKVTQTDIMANTYAYEVTTQLEDAEKGYSQVYYDLSINGETIDCKDVYEFRSTSNEISGGYDNRWKNRKETYVQYSVDPTYTVMIPERVELGASMAVKAEGVVLSKGDVLTVRLSTADGQPDFMLQNEAGKALTYTVTKENTDGEAVALGDTVLTVDPRSASTGAQTLCFNPPAKKTYAGSYTGTVTFIVSVKEGTP